MLWLRHYDFASRHDGNARGVKLAAGWLVQYGSRRPGHSRKLADALRRQEGAQGGSISAAVEWASHGSSGGAIILAVPGSALASDAACAEFARSLGPCAGGQVILDATNPLDADSCSLAWQRGRSSAEALAECLPEAFVYKARGRGWLPTWLPARIACRLSGCLPAQRPGGG